MGISYGARGATVSALQSQLTNAGFSTNGVDGIYGNDTEKAVQRAYASLHVPAASGVASDELIGALAAASGGHSTPPSANVVGVSIPASGLASLGKGKIAVIAAGAAVLALAFWPSKKR